MIVVMNTIRKNVYPLVAFHYQMRHLNFFIHFNKRAVEIFFWKLSLFYSNNILDVIKTGKTKSKIGVLKKLKLKKH